MAVVTWYIEMDTAGNGDAVDITAKLRDSIDGAGLVDGVLTIFVPGATGALTTVEYESGLIENLDGLWERIAPADAACHHDRAWGDGNGHSRLRAARVGPSISVPFVGGRSPWGPGGRRSSLISMFGRGRGAW